jgi:hypothetical protein
MLLAVLWAQMPSNLGCTPATSPDTVYGQLLEAGCLAASSDGVTSIAQEHTAADHPQWLDCMFDGGTVLACHVPCD